jgi:hypothetical protein
MDTVIKQHTGDKNTFSLCVVLVLFFSVVISLNIQQMFRNVNRAAINFLTTRLLV